MTSRRERVLTAGLALVVGIVLGILGTIAHRSVIPLSDATLPWGVVASLGAVAGILFGLRLTLPGRLACMAGAFGVWIAVAVLSFPGRGGSELMRDQPLDLVWVIGVLALAVVAVVVPLPAAPMPASAESAPASATYAAAPAADPQGARVDSESTLEPHPEEP